MNHPRMPGLRRRADGAFAIELWAPRVRDLDIILADGPARRLERSVDGWHRLALPDARPGTGYRLRLDGDAERPDPASLLQTQGVHGPSTVVDTGDFPWTDRDWRGIPLADLIIYETHIGTFTGAGTCAAAIARLDELVELGVTAIEIMPVAQCPGARNWGYDGVLPFAVQASIGGPQGLQALVDACHARGLSVILDVVYNHFGPEGNYLDAYMPIGNPRYQTPWGSAVNVDGPDSDGIRGFLLANARQWFADFHIDGLRLDAVHAICDASATPFLADLAAATDRWSAELGRPLHLIAESDMNASRVIRVPEQGGYGLHAQWADDLHHALHAIITGERTGYLADFADVAHLRDAYARGFVYDGRWSPFRRMTYGDDASDLPTERFVVCIQNHDQVGNRAFGERLASLTDAAGLRCAAAAMLLSPYLPLLFMGEEYGEKRPFLYFVDHGDEGLIDAIRKGRRREFADSYGDGEMPDPAAIATRDRSCIDPPGAADHPLRSFYRACIRLRRSLPSLRPGPRRGMRMIPTPPSVIGVERQRDSCRTLLLINPTADAVAGVALPDGAWRIVLDSAATAWGGGRDLGEEPVALIDLPPRSAVLLAGAPS